MPFKYSKEEIEILLKFIILLILLVFLCFLSNYIYTTYIIRLKFAEDIDNIAKINEKQVFSIDEIVLYSSAGATSNENSNKSVWDLNIYQFTDISIRVNNYSEERINL